MLFRRRRRCHCFTSFFYIEFAKMKAKRKKKLWFISFAFANKKKKRRWRWRRWQHWTYFHLAHTESTDERVESRKKNPISSFFSFNLKIVLLSATLDKSTKFVCFSYPLVVVLPETNDFFLLSMLAAYFTFDKSQVSQPENPNKYFGVVL